MIMNDKLAIEQRVISVLTNFNFTFESFDEAKFVKDISSLEIDIEDYLRSGWREKLVASFNICFFNKEEYKELILRLIFEDFNGKQLKGYILVLITLFERGFALNILNEFLEKYPNSIQIDWVYATKEYLQDKLEYSKGNERKINKINKAFKLIKKYK